MTCRNLFIIVIFGLMFSTFVKASQGLSLGQTRVIFHGGEKRQTLTIKNHAASSWLIQSRVQRDRKSDGGTPFIFRPPLFRLESNSQHTLLIQPILPLSLPEDRESLFTIALLAIPASQLNQGEEIRTSMGIRFFIPLIYRPAKLLSERKGAGIRLRFSSEEDGVLVENPTPFVLTVGSLTLNQKRIDLHGSPLILQPFSRQHISGYKKVSQAQWQVITDYGGLSEPYNYHGESS